MLIRKLDPGFAALGLLADFLAREPPYAQFRAGDLLAALTYQLSSGAHAAGFENNRLIAYCGWLPTSAEAGQAWLQDKGRLSALPPSTATAVALTIVKVSKPEYLRPLIRHCRDRNKGQRVFFKRDYLRDRVSRKASVLNTGA